MAQSQTLDAPRSAAARQVNGVRVWLLAVAALVFLMVSVGGATRLTGSGLSITEWQPIVGTHARRCRRPTGSRRSPSTSRSRNTSTSTGA